jgi:hypothetical protein
VEALPTSPVALVPASQRIAVGRPRALLTPQDLKSLEAGQSDKADYKIELLFDSRRSARREKLVPFLVTMWESGKRLHGGGDDKMYWCGYADCAKPIKSSSFAYAHTACPSCNREVFLDEASKAAHIRSLAREGRASAGIERIPVICGERLCNLPPAKIADLLEKLWFQLEGKADVYFKYSARKIRYDSLNETSRDIDNLEAVRVEREPGIYTLAAIRKDIAAGASLKGRFLSWVLA